MPEETTVAATPAATGKDRTHTDGTSLKSSGAVGETAEPKVEAAAVEDSTGGAEPKPEAGKSERRAERFAKLAREEAAIRAERERNKAAADHVQRQREEIEKLKPILTQVEQFEADKRIATQQTPEGRAARARLLQATGVDFSLYAKDVVEPDKVDPAAITRAELDKWKAEQEQAKTKSETEAKAKAEQDSIARSIADTKAKLKALATDSGEKFSLVRDNAASDSAWDLMVAQYRLDKTELSLEAALERCEKDLERQEADKWKKNTKLQALVKPAAKEKPAATSLKATREPEKSRPVGKPAGITERFDTKRHVNELLAKARARGIQ